MEILRKSESRQVESCVRCGKKTDYTVADSVSVRYHYIDGAGQLCDECYKKINNLKEDSYEDKTIHTV